MAPAEIDRRVRARREREHAEIAADLERQRRIFPELIDLIEQDLDARPYGRSHR
jgi:hypothetical protein